MPRSRNNGGHGHAAWMMMWAMTAELLLIGLFRVFFIIREPPSVDLPTHAAVERQRDAAQSEAGKWQTRFEQADAQRDAVLRSIDDLAAQLDEAARDADDALAFWQFDREQLMEQKRELREDIAALRRQLADAVAEKAGLEQRLADARGAVGETQREHERQLALRDQRERGLRRDLIGLRGDLERVVFVIDRSGSMDTELHGVSRWAHTREVVGQWLRYLPVGHAAIVTFNDHVQTSGQMIPVTGPPDRDALLTHLNDLSPSGYTDTVSALKAAYAYEPTAIILFTDGKPLLAGVSSDRLREAALAFVNQRAAAGQRPVINAIALGDYFESPQMSQFLMALTEQTGGAFLGR